MSNNEEWEKLVQEVERSQNAQRARYEPGALADPRRNPHHDRAAVVPNVLPPYMRKPAAAPERRGPSVGFLVVVFFLCAASAAAFHFLKGNPFAPQNDIGSAASANTTGGPVSPENNWQGGGGMGGAASGSGYQAAIRSALENKLRPANFLEVLGAGKPVELKKISDLKFPADGKPVIAYAVLYARLDEATEKRWRDAGHLKAERVPVNPFMRTVQFSNRSGLDNLLDWHVEGVLLQLPQSPPSAIK